MVKASDNKPIRIHCYDLGGITGYAVLDRDSSGMVGVDSGVMDLRPGQFDSKGRKFHWFRERLLDQVGDGASPTHVYYEKVHRHLGIYAAHSFGGFLGVLQGYCEEHGIPYEGVAVADIKREATGKGRAAKDVVLDAARKRFGDFVVDDNHADALFMLSWVLTNRHKGVMPI